MNISFIRNESPIPRIRALPSSFFFPTTLRNKSPYSTLELPILSITGLPRITVLSRSRNRRTRKSIVTLIHQRRSGGCTKSPHAEAIICRPVSIKLLHSNPRHSTSLQYSPLESPSLLFTLINCSSVTWDSKYLRHRTSFRSISIGLLQVYRIYVIYNTVAALILQKSYTVSASARGTNPRLRLSRQCKH